MAAPVRNPVFARVYAALAGSRLGKAMEKDRRRLLDGLSGRVVEVGAGSGSNFPFYPAAVTSVAAVEPEPYLREKATQAAKRAPVPIEVHAATADTLPFPNASFDAGVFCLVLCSVPSPAAALAEMYRVLKPGGELRFYEHVAGSGPVVSRMQRAADATVWPRMFGGCHTHRDTVAEIRSAGFTIERVKDLSLTIAGIPTPITPHAAGLARRP